MFARSLGEQQDINRGFTNLDHTHDNNRYEICTQSKALISILLDSRLYFLVSDVFLEARDGQTVHVFTYGLKKSQ